MYNLDCKNMVTLYFKDHFLLLTSCLLAWILLAYRLFISTYSIKHILMPDSAWPYFSTPYLNLTTLLIINKQQIRSLLR